METKTLHEIHKQGIDALTKELGPVDAVRFLQIYDSGSGNYTKERKQWLENDPDIYLAAVLAHGKKKTRKKIFLPALSPMRDLREILLVMFGQEDNSWFPAGSPRGKSIRSPASCWRRSWTRQWHSRSQRSPRD